MRVVTYNVNGIRAAIKNGLIDWLRQPDILTVSVPSAIVTRSQNFLLHTLHPDFTSQVRIIENATFQIDSRIVKG